MSTSVLSTPSCNDNALRQRAAVIGAPEEGGGACPLPGHGDHLAVLFAVKGAKGAEVWRLRCDERDEGFGLGEVLAAQSYAAATQRWQRPGKVEVSRWNELLDHRAGLLIPEPVEAVVPADLSPDGKFVVSQMRLLVGLRNAADAARRRDGRAECWPRNREEFTFARRFACARCGFPDRRCRAAIEEVRARRVIVKVGEAGRVYVYRFGRPEEVAGVKVETARDLPTEDEMRRLGIENPEPGR